MRANAGLPRADIVRAAVAVVLGLLAVVGFFLDGRQREWAAHEAAALDVEIVRLEREQLRESSKPGRERVIDARQRRREAYAARHTLGGYGNEASISALLLAAIVAGWKKIPRLMVIGFVALMISLFIAAGIGNRGEARWNELSRKADTLWVEALERQEASDESLALNQESMEIRLTTSSIATSVNLLGMGLALACAIAHLVLDSYRRGRAGLPPL